MRLENLENLLRVCNNKVIVDLEGTDLKSIFLRSRHYNLFEAKNILELSEDDKDYVFDLQKQKIYKLLKVILSENERILEITTHD